MEFEQLTGLLSIESAPVVLLEGRREIPDREFALANRLGAMLCEMFSHTRFRSGNAKGSDQAFSDGVASVDPKRLQIVAPYARHRQKSRYPGAVYTSPETLSDDQETRIADITALASPRNKGLINDRFRHQMLARKAAYLIRDTMKIMGFSEAFAPPAVAIFYADLKDPDAGGTGHTIRVCKHQGIPIVLQDSWINWLN